MEFREEKDSLGVITVPAHAYWGAQTQRAVENFPISGMRAKPDLIKAYAHIKIAAARVNVAAGILDRELGVLIEKAGWAIAEGGLNDHIVVDVFQAGAGTSFNMNINEVIANRANELYGAKRGAYQPVHPNDHVNMSQSTNDTFPTAMRLAGLSATRRLLPELEELAGAFEDKGREFDEILKSGRTHLQDATPVRLGQEFSAYGLTVRKCSEHLRIESISMAELGIGGTAAGTGLNTPPGFPSSMVEELKKLTNIQDLVPSLDMREAMQSQMPLSRTSGALRNVALELGRIANDLRLLSSGPTTGLAEIRLPDLQPGSSIMPGKVNPVMAECMNMVCFQVIGNDLTISQAVHAGQMELNVMMPVIIHNLLQSLDILANMCRAFRQRCVAGITADPMRCHMYATQSLGLATFLSPRLGYETVAKLVQEATENKANILELIRSRGLLTEEEIRKLLDPYVITEPGILTRKK